MATYTVISHTPRRIREQAFATIKVALDFYLEQKRLPDLTGLEFYKVEGAHVQKMRVVVEPGHSAIVMAAS